MFLIRCTLQCVGVKVFSDDCRWGHAPPSILALKRIRFALSEEDGMKNNDSGSLYSSYRTHAATLEGRKRSSCRPAFSARKQRWFIPVRLCSLLVLNCCQCANKDSPLNAFLSLLGHAEDKKTPPTFCPLSESSKFTF